MKKSILAAGLAAAVGVTTAVVPPAMGETTAPQQVTTNNLTTTVTLITGDLVHVANGQVQTYAAKGREGVRFHHYTDERGDLHVIPLDAQPQISAGTLDQRLFDVSLLARSGYDDAKRDTIPLIVQGGAGLHKADAKSLPSIDAHAVTADKKGGFWSAARTAGAAKVWLDGRITASLDRSAAQIGAPQAWQQGFTGSGATVAVLDTGIDSTHPDLQGAVVEEKNFTPAATTDDKFGHGTHVASTITGDGKYKGIAPDAKLVNGKVLDDNGGGSESGVIAGMEWAATKADVVNMSLGTNSPSDGTDLVSQAVNRLTAAHGALFVVSAGNSGGPVASPAAADSALTVGAVERDDKLAGFSSRGPRVGDGAIKPDITAPGVDIVAAKARNGVIGTPVDEGHVSLSGTSMAAPHVAGAAAILAAKNPAWSPVEIKTALMNSAKPHADSSVFDQGAGRVDVARAVTTSPVATPASLSFGTARWPHGDDQPITKKITYRNTGTEPLTLDLTVAEQKPAAAGMFSVSPAKLTVPAGGTAEASVTADTRVPGPDGVYGAAVVASNGTRVPIGVHKEEESYDLTLNYVGRDGKPAAAMFYLLLSFDRRPTQLGEAPNGTVTFRVPKGRYFLSTYFDVVFTDPATRPKVTVAYEPSIEVTGDKTIDFDARTATEPSISVDRKDASQASGSLNVRMSAQYFGYGSGWNAGSSWKDFFIRPSATSDAGFQWSATSVFAKKNAEGGFYGSPYQFHSQTTGKDSMPAAIKHHDRERDMAQVDTTLKARVPGSSGGRNGGVFGPLPFKLTEFYTPNVEWSRYLVEELDPNSPPTFVDEASTTTFRRGARSTEQWNTAVFGPAFPAVPAEWQGAWAGRLGDQVFVNAPVFADGTGEHTTFDFGATTGRTTLSANGKVVAESLEPGRLYTPVPGALTKYQLHTDGSRGPGPSTVTADWTFTSETVAGEKAKTLPLLAVRYAPKLDDNNQARAGSLLTIPVTVQRNGAKANVTDVRPQVEVSYDEGKTWQRTVLFKAGDKWLLTLLHPKNAKSVSFKAKVSDSHGSADQTVVRAYTLK